MNIAQAKSIPLAEFLTRLGCPAGQAAGSQEKHLSPLRDEKTPSFFVHTDKNIWYDHGEGRGGTIIDLAIALLEKQGRSASRREALAFIAEVMGDTPVPMVRPQRERSASREAEGRWIFREAGPIQHAALIHYLKDRGIPMHTARGYLKEVTARHSLTGHTVFALGMQNEDEGWALRNAFLKACIAPNTGSFIRGSAPKPEAIHVFEGSFDFLSVVAREGKPLLHDSYVLHSTSNLESLRPFLYQYGYRSLFSWMDNDAAGSKAAARLREFAAAEPVLTVQAMNPIYEGYKDVNAWHVANPLPGKAQP